MQERSGVSGKVDFPVKLRKRNMPRGESEKEVAKDKGRI